MNKLICNHYEILPEEIEVGRSGIPAIGKHIKTKELVFIKRPDFEAYESVYNQQLHDILNEKESLTVLQGLGSPKLLEDCVYSRPIGNGLRDIPYLVMEFMKEEDRVELIYQDLQFLERIEIIVQ